MHAHLGLTHGTRRTYQGGCACLPCRAANAAYQSALRHARVRGQQPLGGLVDARVLWKQIESLRVEHFTYTEIARRLGLPCLRIQFDTDRVTRKNLWKVRRLYRQIMLEGPSRPPVHD